MELEIRKIADPTSGGLIMQRNKVHHVYTVDRVARDLGVSEALIQDLTLGLEPEDGVIWVYGANDDDGILAFTDEGIEEVKLLLEEYHRVSPKKACPSTPVLRFSWPPDAHVCGLHRMRTFENGFVRVRREHRFGIRAVAAAFDAFSDGLTYPAGEGKHTRRKLTQGVSFAGENELPSCGARLVVKRRKIST
ncbi:hypothetical protein NKJ35_21060 [Mesorhizobium sp. M0136]|uniref:hypothetical protein n=5 Tax=Mesorhizobium TaxID=68287 RepID=UPI00333A2CEB